MSRKTDVDWTKWRLKKCIMAFLPDFSPPHYLILAPSIPVEHLMPHEILAETPLAIGDKDPSGRKAGSIVSARADDTGRDAVRGQLVAANAREIVIRSEHPGIGDVNIHFPRSGFDFTAG
jgi:hypothetical protein